MEMLLHLNPNRLFLFLLLLLLLSLSNSSSSSSLSLFSSSSSSSSAFIVTPKPRKSISFSRQHDHFSTSRKSLSLSSITQHHHNHQQSCQQASSRLPYLPLRLSPPSSFRSFILKYAEDNNNNEKKNMNNNNNNNNNTTKKNTNKKNNNGEDLNLTPKQKITGGEIRDYEKKKIGKTNTKESISDIDNNVDDNYSHTTPPPQEKRHYFDLDSILFPRRDNRSQKKDKDLQKIDSSIAKMDKEKDENTNEEEEEEEEEEEKGKRRKVLRRDQIPFSFFSPSSPSSSSSSYLPPFNRNVTNSNSSFASSDSSREPTTSLVSFIEEMQMYTKKIIQSIQDQISPTLDIENLALLISDALMMLAFRIIEDMIRNPPPRLEVDAHPNVIEYGLSFYSDPLTSLR